MTAREVARCHKSHARHGRCDLVAYHHGSHATLKGDAWVNWVFATVLAPAPSPPTAPLSTMDRLLPAMRVAVRMTEARLAGLLPGRHRLDLSFALIDAYQYDVRDACGLTAALAELHAERPGRVDAPVAVVPSSSAATVKAGGVATLTGGDTTQPETQR